MPERGKEISARSDVNPASLLDHIPALIWEAAMDHTVSTFAGAAAPAFPSCRPGRPVNEVFAGAGNGHAVLRAHQRALAGHTERFDLFVNGREFEAQVKPRLGPGGDISGVLGIALDMTEHRLAERALRFSEYTYRSFVETAPYAICRSTVGGELLQVNRAMCAMLGYSPESCPELLLRDLPAIFSPRTAFSTFQQKLLESGTCPSTDAVWLRRDGESIQVRASGRVVRYPSGDISHFDIFAEDITDKKKLEAELSRAQRMQAIGQLAGGIAHDFNNLLTVIGGHVELMLADPGAPDAEMRLRELREASGKAASLTQQLLAFGRRQVLQSKTLNLNEIIGKLVPMLSRLIRENIQFEFLPASSIGSVKADPNEIERVLVNLAVNAQDAMRRGGRLTISTGNRLVQRKHALQADEIEPGEYVTFAVTDTGIGMDRETQARVFEPFFTTKSPDPGAGLGLSVVYGVVRQSGGYIQIESQPGQGSTFRIYLPLVEGEAASLPPPPMVQTLPQGSETILIAEDDAAIRLLASNVLKHLGYDVLSAPDGQAALEIAKARERPIHLLLTDVVMPGVGGPELATRMKAATPPLHVIFMSGYAAHVLSGDELNRLGACFMQKPFTMESLAKTVRRVLDAAPART